ncbi:MAG TPA: TadE family protein [Bryobacteraceae bacterium]|nr:TadE family protein [Bryobacteraceae bacterium]
MRLWRDTSGQETVEFGLLYAGVLLPLTFSVVFVAEMLWVWHSVVDFTRDGARYAATHCWESDGSNVINYMQSHVPLMIDMDQFQSAGQASIVVQYYSRDPDSGQLVDFTCAAGDCTTGCEPDVVTVSVANYQFTRFVGFFRLPPVTIPSFQTTVPMEGTGCDESGNCVP